MNLPPIFYNRQVRTVFMTVIILGLAYLIANLFVLGGDAFIYSLNSFLVAPLAIITAILAARLWRQMKAGIQSRLLWGGLFLGWVCWAVAESLWASYSLAGSDPFPSWADFFFCLGYLPMAVGLVSRMVGLPKRPDRFQQLLIGVISLLVSSVTIVFILVPILNDYDPDLFWESFLSIFYPLADLVLLLLVLNLLFTYGSGDSGLAWRLILLGFVTVTISDLIFAYTDWNGLYYPDSQANLLSTVAVDVLYSTSYLLWILGSYTLHILLRQHHAFRIDFQPQLTTNAHIFLFTDRNGTVVEVSRNYHRLFSLQEPKGRLLTEALRISDQEHKLIHNRLFTDKKLTDFSLQMNSPSGKLQDGWLCGLPIKDSPMEYSGAIFLLRTSLESEADNDLSEYQRSLLPYILEKSGSSEYHSIRQLLLDYHLAYIKSLFNLILQEGGATMSQALLDELQLQAQKNGWQIQFNPQTIIDSAIGSPARLDQALAALVESARKFASRLTDAITVEREIQKIHSQFGESVHRTVARFREMAKSFADA